MNLKVVLEIIKERKRDAKGQAQPYDYLTSR